MAPGDDLGARRPGRRPRRRRRRPPPSADAGRRGARRVQRGPRPRHRGRRAQRRVRRLGARARRRGARPVRAHRHRRRRRHLARARRAARAPSATTSSTSCAPTTASRSATGRSRSRCRPSAAGWPAARPASSRPATGRSRTWCSGLDVALADGRQITHRRRAPRRGRPRPQPAVRRLRGHARHHHRRPAPPAPRAHARAPGRLRVRLLRRRRRRHAADPPARRHAGRAAPLRPGRGRPHATTPATRALLLVLDEGDGALVDATMELVAEVCRRRRTTPTSAHVEHWLEHRNDVAALEALISRGLRRRHDGGRRPLARPPGDLRRHASTRSTASTGTIAGVGPPVAQLPRRRLPLLHVRRARWSPTTATATTAPCGTPARGPCSPTAARCRHHHGVGLNRSRFVAEALGPGVRRARRHQGTPSTRTASSTPASSGCPPRSAPRGTECRDAAGAGRRPRRGRRPGDRRCPPRWSRSSSTPSATTTSSPSLAYPLVAGGPRGHGRSAAPRSAGALADGAPVARGRSPGSLAIAVVAGARHRSAGSWPTSDVAWGTVPVVVVRGRGPRRRRRRGSAPDGPGRTRP